MSNRPSKEEAAHLQYQTEHSAARKAPSVLPYLALLAAAAFLLLVMAYLMQQRTAESVEGLSQSVNSIQSFDQLVEDNRRLHDEVDELKGSLAESEEARLALAEELKEVKAELAQAQSELEALTAEAEPSSAP